MLGPQPPSPLTESRIYPSIIPTSNPNQQLRRLETDDKTTLDDTFTHSGDVGDGDDASVLADSFLEQGNKLAEGTAELWGARQAVESFDMALSLKPESTEARDDRKTALRLVNRRKQLHATGLETAMTTSVRLFVKFSDETEDEAAESSRSSGQRPFTRKVKQEEGLDVPRRTRPYLGGKQSRPLIPDDRKFTTMTIVTTGYVTVITTTTTRTTGNIMTIMTTTATTGS
ncbi:hypothetical protein AKJ16_DCAP14182 [Drosera capensis]